jgi:SAM-dependent methyltransferase
MSMLPAVAANEDTPPQLIGEFKPMDDWQVHLNALFYGLRGGRAGDSYPTMASADYRLAHALAADYYDHAVRRDRATSSLAPRTSSLVIHEWGCGNGNLAACFLSHLKQLDAAGDLYRKTRYVLVDEQRETLQAALAHPDLAPHRERVATLQADVQDLAAVKDGSLHWILCNELWSELRTKILLRKEGEIIEERLQPNLSDAKYKEFDDWSAFVRAFAARDVAALRNGPSFLDEIIWEKDYQPVDWKRVPYRKTITDFMKPMDDLVIVPANFGAFATIKEARRLLASGGGFTSLDAGTPDMDVLTDPDKPCYGLHGGQYTFIVNFALCETVAKQLGVKEVTVERQREFVSRMLGVNLLTVMDLLETYPSPRQLKPWEQDRLTLKTLKVLDGRYRSPYSRTLDYPIRTGAPELERAELETLLKGLPATGVPDTIAYLSEEEVLGAVTDLEALGFERARIQALLEAGVRREIEYYRFSFTSP